LDSIDIYKLIGTYIDENATFVVMTRANYYQPEFIQQNKNVLQFSCQGTRRQPYSIVIAFQSSTKIKSSCTCPYDGYGICKHQVASLESIMQLVGDGEVNLGLLYRQNTAKTSTLFLKHNDGIIDKEALGQIKFSRVNYQYGEIEIQSITENEITSIFETFRKKNKQSLRYNRAKNEISLTCSCGQSAGCFHNYLFIKQFNEKFGLDYFVEDYETRVKNDILSDYGLNGKIPFDDVFELKISTEGIAYTEKVPNLVKSPNDIFKPFDSSTLKLMNKPKVNSRKHHYGFGICYQFSEDQLIHVFPFYGKLNKQQTAISSKLNVIDDSTLYEAMQLLDAKNIDTLSTSIKLSETYDELDESFSDEVMAASFIREFTVFQKRFQNPIYTHNWDDNFVKKHLTELIIEDTPLTPILEVKENGKFFNLKFTLKIGKQAYPLHSKKLNITLCGIVKGNSLFLVENPEVLLALNQLKSTSEMTILNQGLDQLKAEIIEPYSKLFDLKFKGLKEVKRTKKGMMPIRQVYLSDAENGEYVVFRPIVNYAGRLLKPNSNEKVWLDDEGLTSLKRDYVSEDKFLLFFQSLHEEFNHKNDFFYIKTEDALSSLWLIETIDKLKTEEVEVFGLKDLNTIKYNLHKPTFNTRLSSGIDWFDMNVEIAFGDQNVDLRKLQKAIIKKSNYVELGDGTLGIIPKQWIEKYEKYFKIGQVRKGHIEISNYNFNIIDELYEELDSSPVFLKELKDRKERILNLSNIKPIKPSKHLDAQLRAYQKEGLNWMAFLHENKLGGCLADDMGLGKTLQSIAFLQYLKDKNTKKKMLPSLVVAPTSLIFNWIREFEKFAPNLSTISYTGSKRHDLRDKFTQVDVVLTTYGSLIKDVEFHKIQTYNYVILDESQAIKNPTSQRFKAVRLLKCFNRLAITGTPIENNTFDLYSQFNFLNPGIFGSVKHFRSTFSDAIDKEQDEHTSQLLAKLIKPFLLRRTKAQVAKELPTKTESVIYCEMGPKQRKVYDKFKAHFRERIQEQIENEGINRSQMYILQGLTKLRQICNSTALAGSDEDYGNYSAKLDELIFHLKENVQNHKILVFSQFVGMLKLVKERLDEENIIYEYLDGQTKDREAKVDRFQNDSSVRVFLISLKAGGTGLNLTKADYVYLIDPWWNPAVENQAIDRCYRIGQDNHVIAYRMICKDSIEEQIVALQDKKKFVASEVIRTDIEKKSFDQEDLERFFRL